MGKVVAQWSGPEWRDWAGLVSAAAWVALASCSCTPGWFWAGSLGLYLGYAIFHPAVFVGQGMAKDVYRVPDPRRFVCRWGLACLPQIAYPVQAMPPLGQPGPLFVGRWGRGCRGVAGAPRSARSCFFGHPADIISMWGRFAPRICGLSPGFGSAANGPGWGVTARGLSVVCGGAAVRPRLLFQPAPPAGPAAAGALVQDRPPMGVKG